MRDKKLLQTKKNAHTAVGFLELLLIFLLSVLIFCLLSTPLLIGVLFVSFIFVFSLVMFLENSAMSHKQIAPGGEIYYWRSSSLGSILSRSADFFAAL